MDTPPSATDRRPGSRLDRRADDAGAGSSVSNAGSPPGRFAGHAAGGADALAPSPPGASCTKISARSSSCWVPSSRVRRPSNVRKGWPSSRGSSIATGPGIAAVGWRPLGKSHWRRSKGRSQHRHGRAPLARRGGFARQGQIDLALRLNDLAAGCYPEGSSPQALWRQRGELARSAGQTAEAERLRDWPGRRRRKSPRDRYLLLLTEYRKRGASPRICPCSRSQPPAERQLLGVADPGELLCRAGDADEAMECYDMAAALWPGSHWPHLCRGMACLEQRDYREARRAFDEVIRLRPELWEVYYNRALAKYHLGDHARGRRRLDASPGRAEARPFAPISCGPESGRSKGTARAPGAIEEQGLRAEPRDERDWTARGLARQPRDPRAALADYERALKLNPRYRTALQNKANVLAEGLGRTEEAIAALDTLLALYPNYVPARAGRGVLHARLGRREAAHADARESAAEGHEAIQRLSGRRHLRADVPSGPRRPPGSPPLAGIGPEPGIRPGPDRPGSRSGCDPRPARVPPAGRGGAGPPRRVAARGTAPPKAGDQGWLRDQQQCSTIRHPGEHSVGG